MCKGVSRRVLCCASYMAKTLTVIYPILPAVDGVDVADDPQRVQPCDQGAVRTIIGLMFRVMLDSAVSLV